jgi:hypothetical protein
MAALPYGSLQPRSTPFRWVAGEFLSGGADPLRAFPPPSRPAAVYRMPAWEISL